MDGEDRPEVRIYVNTWVVVNGFAEWLGSRRSKTDKLEFRSGDQACGDLGSGHVLYFISVATRGGTKQRR